MHTRKTADLLGFDFEGMMEFLGQMSKQEIDDDKLIRNVMRVIRSTYTGMPGRANGTPHASILFIHSLTNTQTHTHIHQTALDVLRREYQASLQSGGNGLQIDV